LVGKPSLAASPALLLLLLPLLLVLSGLSCAPAVVEELWELLRASDPESGTPVLGASRLAGSLGAWPGLLGLVCSAFVIVIVIA